MSNDEYKYGKYMHTNQQTRWATNEEIYGSTAHVDLTAEHYPAAGLPVLSDAKTAYVDNEDHHTLIFGATGSKKTRLFCMPMINMFAKAGESFIVSDPKGELYANSAGLAKKLGYDVIVLNFRDMELGDRWNPFAIPYDLYHAGKRDQAMGMCADFIKALAAPQEQNTKDAYWPEMAQCLLNGAAEFLLEVGTKEQMNVGSLSRFCCGAFIDVLKNITDEMDDNSTAGLNLKSVFNAPPVTRQSIIAVAYGMVRLFNTQQSLCDKMSESTFDMSQIGRKKTAVYVIIPDEKTTYHFIVTVFVKQVYEILIEEAQKQADRKLPVRVNFMLDEFCNIPKIPDMPMMISAARSRNMRFFLVVQSLYQLKTRYGDDANTIKGNCENWVFLTTKELELLRELSELCGDVIVPSGQVRPLISQSELQRLNKQKGEALIIHARQYPIICELPDISDYKMFGTEPAPEFVRLPKNRASIFNLREFEKKIDDREAIAPFPTESHLSYVISYYMRYNNLVLNNPDHIARLDEQFGTKYVDYYLELKHKKRNDPSDISGGFNS